MRLCISFEEIAVSLDCCTIGLLHSITKNICLYRQIFLLTERHNLLCDSLGNIPFLIGNDITQSKATNNWDEVVLFSSEYLSA